MMKGFVLIAAALASLSAHADRLWIVGTNGITYWDTADKPVMRAGVHFSSVGFDERACSVWTADDETHRLAEILPGLKDGRAIDGVAAVVSDPIDGRFYTRESDGKTLRARDLTGNPVRDYTPAWAGAVERIIRGDGDALLSLNVARYTQVSFARFVPATGESKETLVSTEASRWGEQRIEYDGVRKNLWVAYTYAPPTGPYRPRAELWRDGARVKQETWDKKGRVYDTCLEADGTLFMGRDFPSDSGFTVPVYSYLEAVTDGTAKAVTRYRADDNSFFDAQRCLSDRIFFAQRSIFGSDGSWLVEWNRDAKARAKEHFKLPPGPTLAIYRCR